VEFRRWMEDNVSLTHHFCCLSIAGVAIASRKSKMAFREKSQGRSQESSEDIYCGSEAEVDESLAELQKLESESHLHGLSFEQLFAKFLLPIFIIVMLMALGQLTGSVVVRNYAPTIFKSAGISTLRSLELNTIISVINLFVVVIATYFVDQFGRIKILCCGFVVAGVGMLILALGFLASDHSVAVFLVGGAFTSAGFNMGFGPVGWILSSELFPTKIRGRALSISILARNAFEFMTNFLFLGIVSGIGASGTFFIFFVFCVVSLLFTIFGLVETRGLEPYEILSQLSSRSMWRAPRSCLGATGKEENAFLMNNMASNSSPSSSGHGLVK
jgi:SP family arabinose:H+ symporter-like MFS transporter